MKKRYILLLWVALLAAVPSCVYDYNPQIDGEGGYLIVEGDIILGERCGFSLSYSWTLVDTLATSEDHIRVLYGSRMHIEDNRGGRYEPASASGAYSAPYAEFDMRKADPSLEYRLVIENNLGTYASSWGKAAPDGGEIDSLSFRISDDKTTMGILVSTHSSDPQGGYYRWSVNETWEYHAMTDALYKYVVYSPAVGEVLPLDRGEQYFRCWSTGVRPEIMTGSTVDLTEDRLVNHLLYTLDYHDERVSVIYKPEVLQMRIPEEAYRYWEVMDRNSRDVGGLFSPEPSELRGNVVNVDKPDELVLGYVGVMSVTRKTMFIDNSLLRFYRNPSRYQPEIDTLSNGEDYWKAYQLGKRPVTDIFYEVTGDWVGYDWWPKSCMVCRSKGGTTTRPEGWPY